MITIEVLSEFFGWCVVINVGILLLSFLMVTAFRKGAVQIHARLFGLEPDVLSRAYFQYLAQFKIATLVLSVTPYIALKLMA